MEKTKPRVPLRIQNDQQSIEEKNLGSVGVEESQGVTAGAMSANDGLNILLLDNKNGNKIEAIIAYPGVSRRPSLCSCPYNYEIVGLDC